MKDESYEELKAQRDRMSEEITNLRDVLHTITAMVNVPHRVTLLCYEALNPEIKTFKPMNFGVK